MHIMETKLIDLPNLFSIQDVMLAHAKNSDVAFLVVGDPFGYKTLCILLKKYLLIGNIRQDYLFRIWYPNIRLHNLHAVMLFSVGYQIAASGCYFLASRFNYTLRVHF